MVTREQVMAALAGLATPEGGGVATSGRVRSLVIDEGRVGVALAFPDPPAAEAVRRAAEEAVRRLEGVDEVLVAIVADDPDVSSGAQGASDPQPSREGLVQRARRLVGRGDREAAPRPQPVARAPGSNAPAAPARRPADALTSVERIVAVGSGKGGVGKSTVAANLAVALAATGWRVGLLDADIFGPSVPTLFGGQEFRPTGALTPLLAHGVHAMSIGFLVDPGKAVVWRGPMVTGALMQLVRDTEWGELDLLVIDMPPGTGDIQLSLAQQIALDGAVVVTTPQDLSLIDVRKATAMFATVNVPILGVIENMSTFVCPHCGEATEVFGHGGGEREAAAQSVAFLGRMSP